MYTSRILSCLLFLFAASGLEAAKDKSVLGGRVEMTPYPQNGVSVDLQIYSAAEKYLGQIHLSVDSTANHRFREKFPESWNGNEFLVRVEVGAPAGYVSQWPDYTWKKGQSLVLVLKKKADAYENWSKVARRADRLELAINRLEALEDWDLEPAEKLRIIIWKADSYDRWKEWRIQQDLLRDSFQPEFQRLPKELVANYFRLRFNGFAKLVKGDFPSILQAADLRDLWENLVDDFAGQYSSCSLDSTVSTAVAELTPAIIATQRKTLKTWLGRPGATVGDCPVNQTTFMDRSRTFRLASAGDLFGCAGRSKGCSPRTTDAPRTWLH